MPSWLARGPALVHELEAPGCGIGRAGGPLVAPAGRSAPLLSESITSSIRRVLRRQPTTRHSCRRGDPVASLRARTVHGRRKSTRPATPTRQMSTRRMSSSAIATIGQITRKTTIATAMTARTTQLGVGEIAGARLAPIPVAESHPGGHPLSAHLPAHPVGCHDGTGHAATLRGPRGGRTQIVAVELPDVTDLVLPAPSIGTGCLRACGCNRPAPFRRYPPATPPCATSRSTTARAECSNSTIRALWSPAPVARSSIGRRTMSMPVGSPELVVVPVAPSEFKSRTGHHPGRRPDSPRPQRPARHHAHRALPSAGDGEPTRRAALIAAIQTELVAQASGGPSSPSMRCP